MTETRDELLTRLALTLAKWPDTEEEAVALVHPLGFDFIGDSLHFFYLTDTNDEPIYRHQWQMRREDLINEPEDRFAPNWAAYKAQDDSGDWAWFGEKPRLTQFRWEFRGRFQIEEHGTIPAGHDWRKTCKRVERNIVPKINSNTGNVTVTDVRFGFGFGVGGVTTSFDNLISAQAKLQKAQKEFQEALQKANDHYPGLVIQEYDE